VDPLRVRLMHRDDLPVVRRLIVEDAGWGDPGAQPSRILSVHSEGCFVAVRSGEPVGIVFSILYGRVGWIGYLIVRRAHRAAGIGTLLMERCMAALQRSGAETMRLYAVAEAVPIYRRLGFVEEGRSLRYLGSGTGQGIEGPTPLDGRDVPEILALDRQAFGSDRSRILEGALTAPSSRCFVARSGGSLIGYAVIRWRSTHSIIGPWICRRRPDGETPAAALFDACRGCARAEPVTVGIPGENRLAEEIVRGRGFEERPGSVRMRRGPEPAPGEPEAVFGIAGAAKG